MPVVHPEWIGR